MKYWKLYIVFWCFTGAVSGWSQTLDSVLLHRMALDLCKPGDSLLHHFPYLVCYGEQDPTPQPYAESFTHTICAWLTTNRWCLEVEIYECYQGADHYYLRLSQQKALQITEWVLEKYKLAHRFCIKGMGKDVGKVYLHRTQMLLKIQRCP